MSLGSWNPTEILSSDRTLPTASQVVVVSTDLGTGYLKAISSHTNRHQLAAEWVGTGLTDALGMPTLEAGVINVPSQKIKLYDGSFAANELAFITKQASHMDWSGSIDELEKLPRHDHFALLVLLDTWIRNWDRYPPPREDGTPRGGNEKNVFLGWNDEDKAFELTPMDFGHAIIVAGQISSELTSRIQDDQVFGLFPAFRQLLDDELWESGFASFAGMDAGSIDSVVDSVPQDWIATDETRAVLKNFLHERYAYILREKDRIIRQALNDRLPFAD